MSYVVEQKIKGRLYLYRVESYWDKVKKQARQKRTYLGPKNKKKRACKYKKREIIYKKYGNIFLLRHITRELKLDQLMKNCFPGTYSEILALAYFHLCDDSAMYLFPYWQDEQCELNCRKLYSSEISELCDSIGGAQKSVRDFFERWVASRKPVSGVYYDVTSISSYSTNMDFVEWGYNRDGENLRQINLGVACERENGLPLFYRLYPGSINDVTTLENHLKMLDLFELDNVLISLDRGFCSKSNIIAMNSRKDKLEFVQPMTFSMKAVTRMLKANRAELKKNRNAFKFGEDILHHVESSMSFDKEDSQYRAFLYYNEKADLDQRHSFLSKLFDIEKELSGRRFETMKEYLAFKHDNIHEKFAPYFKLERSSGKIVKNERKINARLSKSGFFILLSNSLKLDGESVLAHYRDRDIVEKMFDVGKDELEEKRLRAHDQSHADGRVFIKFIALILHARISSIMRNTGLNEKFSFRELMRELAKIRYSKLENDEMFSELTKTQKKLLKDFQITPEMLKKHSY
jgi:transposase